MFTNSLVTRPNQNIYEDWFVQFTLLLADNVEKDKFINNEYINKYYKHINKAIKVSHLFDKYIKCNGVHTITSQEEFDFFISLDGVPLTKKYYYTINSKNNISQVNNKLKVDVTLNVKGLVYNDFLRNNLFNNIYLLSNSYISGLSTVDTVTIEFGFRDSEFTSLDTFTSYVNSSEFDTRLLGHMNCILFNDIIIQDAITNGSTYSIISSSAFDEKFIIKMENGDYYIEDDIDNYSYKITNQRDATIVNEINLSISKIPLYENIIYIKTMDTTGINYEMSMIERMIPITTEYLSTEYNTLVIGNKYFFETYNLQASQKFLNKQTIGTAKLFTDDLFNNFYQVETVGDVSGGIINIYTSINGVPTIIKKYPYRSTEEKFKITAILPHSASLHLVRNIKSDNVFVNHEFSEEPLTIDSSIIDSNSQTVQIQMTKHFNEWENNGNIQHYDIDEYDTPRWDTTSTITKTYGSCFTDLKFFGGGKSLSTMYGDFLVPCYEGFAHPVSGEALQKDATQHQYRTMNNINMSNYVLTNLNNYANEFTMVFLTNKYGYTNNYMKLGDFQENVYGKIIICKDTTNSINNIVYHVPVEQWEDGYDSLLHIITHKDNHLTYDVYSDTTHYCSLDVTTSNIDDCNLSVLNIIGHKKTDNWTTRTETGKPMPTRKEVSLYRNVVQLSDYTGGRFNYELMDLRTAKNAVRDRFEAAQLSYYAFGADVPEFPNQFETYTTDQNYIIEFTAPGTLLHINAYLNSYTAPFSPNNYSQNVNYQQLFKGTYPDNMNNEVAIHYDPATPDLDSTTFFSRTFYITTPGQKYYLLFRPDMQRGDINLQNFKNFQSSDWYRWGLELTDNTSIEKTQQPFVNGIAIYPKGYDEFKEDWGYNAYRTKTEEYLSIGLPQVYNQKLSTWRLNKIKQSYQNKRTKKTALMYK